MAGVPHLAVRKKFELKGKGKMSLPFFITLPPEKIIGCTNGTYHKKTIRYYVTE
jgi:hypothetical protein